MAIQVGHDEGDPMVEPNVIPLVDIMLVLLIIMIITVPVMTQAVKIDLPKEINRPTDTKPENINLSIDFDGSIYWNESSVDRAQMLNLRAGGSREGSAAGGAHPRRQAGPLRGRGGHACGTPAGRDAQGRLHRRATAQRRLAAAGSGKTDYGPATGGPFSWERLAERRLNQR